MHPSLYYSRSRASAAAVPRLIYIVLRCIMPMVRTRYIVSQRLTTTKGERSMPAWHSWAWETVTKVYNRLNADEVPGDLGDFTTTARVIPLSLIAIGIG